MKEWSEHKADMFEGVSFKSGTVDVILCNFVQV